MINIRYRNSKFIENKGELVDNEIKRNYDKYCVEIKYTTLCNNFISHGKDGQNWLSIP